MTNKDYVEGIGSAASQVSAYTPSSDVAAANRTLADVNAGKPTEYTNRDADRLGGLYESIMNRNPFSYDMNGDALYQQYKGMYQQAGQNAAQQTMQTNRQLAGGYADTWSQAAANQQYGAYLQGMNDILPQLEQNAYNAYASEGNRLNQLYQMGVQQEQTAYDRYRDSVNDWRTDREFAAQQADNAYARDYQAYSDRLNMAGTVAGWQTEDAMQNRSDMYTWALTLIQQGIMPTADVLSQAGISAADALALANKTGKSSGGGGRRRGKGGGTTKTETPDGNDNRTGMTR